MLTVAHMTSVVDGRRNSGTARVARELITHLSRDTEIHQFLIHFDHSDDSIYSLPNSTEILIPVSGSGYARHFRGFVKFWLSYRLSRKAPIFDIAHWHSSRVFPFFFLIPAKKILINLHDAGQNILKGVNTFSTRIFYWNLRIFISKIDLILGVSKQSALELHTFAKFPSSKITYIYNGTEFGNVVPNRIQGVDISSEFLLCVSRWQPHKNVETLIKAIAILKSSEIELPQLVLVGKIVGGHSAPEDEIRAAGLENSVLVLSDLTDNELAYLYDHALLNVFPSLHEGFGLSVLEGMSRGCPALVHSRASTAEIVSDSGFLTDMTNPSTVAETLSQILELRSELALCRKSSKDRSLEFTWDSSAAQIKQLYEKLLGDI